MGAVAHIERHNERRNKNYSNKDIDLSRSSENYHLKTIQAETYCQEFERIRQKYDLKGNLRLTGQKQSTVLCEFITTSDKDFFDRLGAEGTKRFFERAYNFATIKCGEEFILSVVVHMDEKTPHMHVTFIPVIDGKDRKGKPCKRINCSEFWKGRDSYARLQDEYFDYMANTCGYSLERGVKGSEAEHLSVAEYKLKKTEEQLTEVTKQLSEIEAVEEIKGKSIIPNTVTLKKSDYEKLSSVAKSYVTAKAAEEENITLKAECLSLQNENETLKAENDKISAQYKELDMNYGAYYDETANERELIKENDRLKDENRRIGNQVHTLAAEVSSLKEENISLKITVDEANSTVTAKEADIHALTAELAEKKTLLQALQQKFDKVMEFLRIKNLKEEWERFLAPVIHHKLR